MARVKPETRKQLEAAGLWREFLHRRQDLKDQGYKPVKAMQLALEETLEGVEPVEAADEVAASPKSTSASKAGLKKLKRAPISWGGRGATEPEVVRWVARNIDEPDPDPESCPDPFAWTLLCRCRESVGFTDGFIDKLWSKLIPSRAHLDTTQSDTRLDGQEVLDLIARIQAISKETAGELLGTVDEIPEEEFELYDPQETP